MMPTTSRYDVIRDCHVAAGHSFEQFRHERRDVVAGELVESESFILESGREADRIVEATGVWMFVYLAVATYLRFTAPTGVVEVLSTVHGQVLDIGHLQEPVG